MPRGIRKQPTEIQSSQQQALCDPAIRAKAKETWKKRRVIRSIDSLATADLAPIDEEIKQLQAQLARLENARKLILTLRGEMLPNGDAAPRVKPPAAIGVDGSILADKIFRHLKTCAPQTLAELCDYFDADRTAVARLLNDDKRFTLNVRGGWVLQD